MVFVMQAAAAVSVNLENIDFGVGVVPCWFLDIPENRRPSTMTILEPSAPKYLIECMYIFESVFILLTPCGLEKM